MTPEERFQEELKQIREFLKEKFTYDELATILDYIHTNIMAMRLYTIIYGQINSIQHENEKLLLIRWLAASKGLQDLIEKFDKERQNATD